MELINGHGTGQVGGADMQGGSKWTQGVEHAFDVFVGHGTEDDLPRRWRIAALLKCRCQRTDPCRIMRDIHDHEWVT